MRVIIIVALVSLFTTCIRGVPVQKQRSYGNFVPKAQNSFEIFNPSPIQTSTLSGDPVSIAINFFASHAKVLTDSITVSSFHTSDHNGVTHVYLQQVINGLEVSNGVGNVNVDKNGHVISVGKSFYTGPVPTKEGKSYQPKLSAKDAVAAFGKFLNIPSASVGELGQTESLSRNGGSGFSVSGASFAVKEITAVLKYIQVNGGSEITLVWSLEVETKENMYNAFVDVNDGEVVGLIDWVSDLIPSYTVYPFGVNDPDDGARKTLFDPSHPVASKYGWHNSLLITTTTGNNVWAQENHDGDDDYIEDYRPIGLFSAFNFPINFNDEPQQYKDAAITNLFYWNNIVHDLFYLYGFNEPAGNFQDINNPGVDGGAGGDGVIAHAQDGGGTNNANFASPPDGQKGRMRMYLFDITNPYRDGDLDSGIIVHEYGHGISTRLTGGRLNSGCLPDGESGGMGEGWSDVFATIIRVTSTTTRSQNYAMGAYSFNDPEGIRKYLYSTDLEITNPSTYNYITRSGYEGVHAKGEVWAVILYEVFWNLVEKNGFSTDWYNPNASGGNVQMLRLLVDGMKLQPCEPNFVQARNAIIQADLQDYGGANKCALWKGFAKRGLGTAAGAGGFESFAVPSECI